MDKKSIIGIAVVAVLFLGFAYFNSQQQKEYLEQKAAYEAYVDSVAAAARAAAPVADSLASGNGVQAEVAAAEAAAAVRERQVETLVVTSDATIQDTVFGGGVDRMSADGFSREMASYDEEARLDETPKVAEKRTVASRIDPETLAKLKALRDGR